MSEDKSLLQTAWEHPVATTGTVVGGSTLLLGAGTYGAYRTAAWAVGGMVERAGGIAGRGINAFQVAKAGGKLGAQAAETAVEAEAAAGKAVAEQVVKNEAAAVAEQAAGRTGASLLSRTGSLIGRGGNALKSAAGLGEATTGEALAVGGSYLAAGYIAYTKGSEFLEVNGDRDKYEAESIKRNQVDKTNPHHFYGLLDANREELTKRGVTMLKDGGVDFRNPENAKKLTQFIDEDLKRTQADIDERSSFWNFYKRGSISLPGPLANWAQKNKEYTDQIWVGEDRVRMLQAAKQEIGVAQEAEGKFMTQWGERHKAFEASVKDLEEARLKAKENPALEALVKLKEGKLEEQKQAYAQYIRVAHDRGYVSDEKFVETINVTINGTLDRLYPEQAAAQKTASTPKAAEVPAKKQPGNAHGEFITQNHTPGSHYQNVGYNPHTERGHAGPSVGALQKMLKAVYPEAVLTDNGKPTDDMFGPKTEGALKRFQQEHHLQPNGKADDSTIKTLFAEASQKVQQDRGITLQTSNIDTPDKIVKFAHVVFSNDHNFGGKDVENSNVQVVAGKQHHKSQTREV